MTKNRKKTESVETASPDLLAERAEKLKEIFPEAFSEGRVDFEKLRAALGDMTDDRPERYSFTWAGKRDAIRLLQTSSRATLVPAPEESIDFDTTQNIFIEGDNLEVLKLLYKSYAGRVKMIYIDPPYNTGNDFIYPDNFADPLQTYLTLTGQKDERGNLLTSNPETSGRYHSAWLSMMYPRLFIARQLLHQEGFLVLSIDDAEIHNVKAVLHEIFGEENYVAILVWDRNRKNDAKLFSVGHEYMLVYARDKLYLRNNDVILRASKEGVEDVRAEFEKLRKEFQDDWHKITAGLRNFFKAMGEDDPRKPLGRFNKVDKRGPYRDDGNINRPKPGGPRYDVIHPRTGKPCKVPRSGWRFSKKGRMEQEIAKGNVIFGNDETTVPGLKTYLFEKDVQVMRSVHYSYAQTASDAFDTLFDQVRVFDNPKHFEDLAQVIQYLTDDFDIILDFFAGSCSTAHAVLDSNRKSGGNRKFACVQLPELVNSKKNAGESASKLNLLTIADIGKERIRRVINKIKKESEGKLDLKDRDEPEDLGFRVYKLSESHFRRWTGVEDKNPQKWIERMELFTDPLLPGWEPLDMIHEIALEEGYGLGCRVEQLPTKETKKNTVYRVADEERGQSFLICLDADLHADTPRNLKLGKNDLFICRNVALTDNLIANLALQCRLKTI